MFISTAFKSILSQSRCSLEPTNFPRGTAPPKSPAEGLRTPSSDNATSVNACHTCFSTDYVCSWDNVCLLSNVLSWVLRYTSLT